ncbi:MAG: hypothetical protein KBT34_05745 [Prevotella sp.]|nr:hypothetical protein [Candidatus Prevotella equi]
MTYNIGGHNIRISFDGEETMLDTLLHSFVPFKTTVNDDADMLMHLHVVKYLKEIPEEDRRLIRDVDTGNGMTRVDKLKNGGYQFLVRDIYGVPCALLITSAHFDDCRCALRGSMQTKRFALNNALMLAYAFSAAYYDTLLIHASVIRHNDKAYAFTAKSGTGKSTQVANWMRNIEGCDIVNDDNPIIRIIDGKPILFGSPWSGKTPCYRNIKVNLGAIVLIERAQSNSVTPMIPLQGFTTLLTACSAMKWDEELYQRVCKTVSLFVESTQVVTLHCLPDADSAHTCRAYLEDNNNFIEYKR